MVTAIRKAVEAYGGVRAAARAWGVAASLVSRAANAYIPPPPSILAVLGYERVTTYRVTKGGTA